MENLLYTFNMQTDSTISPQDNLTVSDEKLCKNIKPIDNINYNSDKKMFNFDDTNQINVNNNVLLRYNMTDDMKPVYDKSIPTDTEEYWSNVYFEQTPTKTGKINLSGISYKANMFLSDKFVDGSIDLSTTNIVQFEFSGIVETYACLETNKPNTLICFDISTVSSSYNKQWYMITFDRSDPTQSPTKNFKLKNKLYYTDVNSFLMTLSAIVYKDNTVNVTYAKTWSEL